MKEYEEKLKKYILDNNIKAEQLIFEESCHTVEKAAEAVNAPIDDFVKNICMVDNNGKLIVAIVKGEDRASTTRVKKVLNKEVRLTVPDEILKLCGYICGGVPSFGFNANFLIDPKVMEKDIVYTGGGSPYSLVKISTEELLRVNKGQVIRVRK